MKKRLYFTLTIVFTTVNLFSQKKNLTDTLSFPNQIQIEAFGPGSLFSINYETKFPSIFRNILSEKARLRFGIGGTPLKLLGPSCNTGGLITFPVGVSYIFGDGFHHLEASGGFVLTVIPGTTKIHCLDFDYGFFSEETTTYTYVLIGYRWQPANKKKPVFRAFVSPLFPFKFWGGASIGFQL